jgi:tetratricopeptide (TPR) repeat protein
MQGSQRTQLLLISGAVVLAVGLYLAPRASSSISIPVKLNTAHKQEFSFEELLSYQNKNLTANELQKTESWLADLKQPASRVNLSLYDSVANVWDGKKSFALSAHFYELKAEKDNTEKSFLNAAYRYFDSYKGAIDSTLKIAMLDKAIKNYSKVLVLNPKNLDAKTDLGILYAEGTSEPMKGIMMLREVVAENPNHENAQINLGFLSVKSGQFDKALERFDKVLNIDPKRVDVYVYKAQVYIQMGDKQKAIENFKKFKQLSDNKEMVVEVDQYMEELNKKNE